MARLFERHDDGTFRLTLHEHDARLLSDLATGLAGLLVDEPTGDEVVERLFPRAYLDPTEEESELTWQELVRPDLRVQKTSSLQALVAGLEAAPRDGVWVQARLDDAAVEQWLVAVNDLRLALGTRIGIEEDTDFGDLDPDDPATAPYFIYAWLTQLAGTVVEVLLGDDWSEPIGPFGDD